MEELRPHHLPQPYRPGSQRLVGLAQIPRLELGLSEAPLWGLWGRFGTLYLRLCFGHHRELTPALAGCLLLCSSPVGGLVARLVHCGLEMGVGGERTGGNLCSSPGRCYPRKEPLLGQSRPLPHAELNRSLRWTLGEAGSLSGACLLVCYSSAL